MTSNTALAPYGDRGRAGRGHRETPPGRAGGGRVRSGPGRARAGRVRAGPRSRHRSADRASLPQRAARPSRKAGVQHRGVPDASRCRPAGVGSVAPPRQPAALAVAGSLVAAIAIIAILRVRHRHSGGVRLGRIWPPWRSPPPWPCSSSRSPMLSAAWREVPCRVTRMLPRWLPMPAGRAGSRPGRPRYGWPSRAGAVASLAGTSPWTSSPARPPSSGLSWPAWWCWWSGWRSARMRRRQLAVAGVVQRAAAEVAQGAAAERARGKTSTGCSSSWTSCPSRCLSRRRTASPTTPMTSPNASWAWASSRTSAPPSSPETYNVFLAGTDQPYPTERMADHPCHARRGVAP